LRGVYLRSGRAGLGRPENQRDFAFHGMLVKRLHQFKKRAATKLFVQLGDFPREASRAVAQNCQRVGQRFRDAVRRLVENDGAVFDAQVFQRAAAFAGAMVAVKVSVVPAVSTAGVAASEVTVAPFEAVRVTAGEVEAS